MDPATLTSIVQWSGGNLVHGNPHALASGVSTDSRTIAHGDLFIALRGDTFDGHDFVAEVAKRGAVAALVDREISFTGLSPEFGLIRVTDTLAGLQELARNHRRNLTLHVACITGSNGKTSTKDFSAAVLARRYSVSATRGNLNNHIGLPITILQTSSQHQIGVWEIGMNHAGEIAPLAALAMPNVGVITNIGTAHIGLLGSREAIAQEKGMLAESLMPTGTLILPAEDEFTGKLARRTKADVVLCGIDCGDVRAEQLAQSPEGSRFRVRAGQQVAEAEFPVPGRHMVQNALFAIAVGRTLGVALEECVAGLRSPHLTKGRLDQKTIHDVWVIDDTYNANPDSMIAALRVMAELPVKGRRIAVFGQMAELGDEAERGHRQVGKAAAELGVDTLITLAGDSRFIAEEAKRTGVPRTVTAESVEEAAGILKEVARPGDLVLVKGSRSARMERILEAWAAS